MPVAWTVNHKFLRPENGEILSQNSLIVYDAMLDYVEYDVLYTMEELLTLVKQQADPVLRAWGQPKMNLVGDSGTDIMGALNNLWRNGYIRKASTSVYIRSGRPTGVSWMIKWH